MSVSDHIRQSPPPGTRLTACRGDTIFFPLEVPADYQGLAAVRTNIGQASIVRSEVVMEVEREEVPLARGWQFCMVENG